MNIYRTVLIAVALVLEKIDKKITEEQNNLEATQKPLEAPKEPDPSKCICEGINQPTDKTNAFLYCSKHNRTYLNNQYVNEDMPVYRKPPLTLEQIKDKYRTARIDTFNSSLPIRHYYNHNTGIITNKELKHLLSEANTLLDEIEVTINKMFAAALKAQKT